MATKQFIQAIKSGDFDHAQNLIQRYHFTRRLQQDYGAEKCWGESYTASFHRIPSYSRMVD